MDGRKGGWSGSLDLWALRDAKGQARTHPKMHLVRYGAAEHIMRGLFSIRTFGGFIGLYLFINLMFGALEVFSVHFAPSWLPDPGRSDPELAVELEGLMLNVSSYLLGAQIGLLGVISLSLTLVTLIAQREGSSTDIQLYYHESLALELVASCVALSVVLCLQFVWPLQMLLYHVGLGAGMQVFKLTLFSLHLFWLLVNLCVAAYFIIITFQFVQQSARERFRNRYTAYVVLPRDLRRALREQLYSMAGQETGGGQPQAFVFANEGEGAPELLRHFSHPAALSDVHMAGVKWVAHRWQARCLRQKSDLEQQEPPCLFFSPRMDEPLHGMIPWCHRRGGVPLSRIERLVLNVSFRFQRVRPQHQEPTPAHILEGLIENTIAQVDRQTPVAFDSALGELLRYHQFVLGLSVARDVDGRPFSFTELPGFGWHPQHRPWSGQYRRLFYRAGDYLGEDAHFFHALSQTPSRLLPHRGEAPLPLEVTQELFRLGPLLTRSLERWGAHRMAADGGEQSDGVLHLSGMDAVAHREAVPLLIDAWEHMLRDVPHLYGWPVAARLNAACQWAAFRESYGFLSQHLCETAHSLAIAVRHGDVTAAAGFVAALGRWPRQVLGKGDGGAEGRHDHGQNPALMQMEWDKVLRVVPEAAFLGPSALFTAVIQNAHADMLLMTAGLLLSHASESESDMLCAEMAGALLPTGMQTMPAGLASFSRLAAPAVGDHDLLYKNELKRAFHMLGTVLASSPQEPAFQHEPEWAWLTILLAILPEQDGNKGQSASLSGVEALQGKGAQQLVSLLSAPSPQVETGLRLLQRAEGAADLCARLKRLILPI